MAKSRQTLREPPLHLFNTSTRFSKRYPCLLSPSLKLAKCTPLNPVRMPWMAVQREKRLRDNKGRWSYRILHPDDRKKHGNLHLYFLYGIF